MPFGRQKFLVYKKNSRTLVTACTHTLVRKVCEVQRVLLKLTPQEHTCKFKRAIP